MSFQVKLNLSEQIAEYVSDKIIRMEMKPGERILETAIADALNVSRSPIREALRILEQKRLVELIPRKGARVTKLSKEFAGHLFDILSSLLQLAATTCSLNGSDEDLKQIDNAAQECHRCSTQNDDYGYYQAIFKFAMACLKATGNPLLEHMVLELMPNVRRILYATFAIKGEDLEDNAKILLDGNRYVQARNPEMARKIIGIYMQKAREYAMEISS